MEPQPDGAASIWGSPLVDVGIWLIAFAAITLTVWYSLGPRPPNHGSDKQLHVVAYLVDTFVILLALIWRPGRAPRRFDGWALPVALGVLLMGGVIEVAQDGFAHRDAQVGDWIADAIGIGLALLLFGLLRWTGGRKTRSDPLSRP